MEPTTRPILRRTLSTLLLFLLTITAALSQVVAWGYNGLGQCNVPASLDGQTVTAISAGAGHSLALTSAGKVVAWGANGRGQCDVPASLASQTVVGVSGGAMYSLALTSTGKVVAWGDNTYGQCNVPDALDGQTVTAIAAGAYHCLALTRTGKVVAWGYNRYGEFEVPKALDGQTVTAIAAGGFHCLALTIAGRVVAWGDHSLDRCDVPESLDGQTVTAIAAGGCGYHSLALTSTGKVVGWGYNANFQCDVPKGLDGQTVTAIAAGGHHSLAVTSVGKIVVWGDNSFEQCDVPASLDGQTVTAIAGGLFNSLAFVTPRPAPSFSVTSSAFIGGTAATITGKLTFATATTEDVTVSLSSSNSAISVPASIIVPAGSTTATFNLSSVPVASLRHVKLTAQPVGYLSATKRVTVTPQIVTLAVSPSSFQGGTSAFAKVTLWTASATDTVVKLVSRDPRVSFGLGIGESTTVTIPANEKSAGCYFYSTEVATPTTIEMTAKPGISTQTGSATFTLTPAPKIYSFTASRSTVYGNQKTTFTIKLASMPGPNGTTVALTYDGVGITGGPTDLFFPVGVRSKSFDVFADEDAATGSVLVTATSGLSSAVGKTITIKQLKVTGSTLSASSVTGGSTVDVTVNLNATVDRDTAIGVASSDPTVASVPSAVIVPAGAKSVTFTVTTYSTTVKKSVKITSSKGGYTSSKSLVVTP